MSTARITKTRIENCPLVSALRGFDDVATFAPGALDRKLHLVALLSLGLLCLVLLVVGDDRVTFLDFPALRARQVMDSPAVLINRALSARVAIGPRTIIFLIQPHNWRHGPRNLCASPGCVSARHAPLSGAARAKYARAHQHRGQPRAPYSHCEGHTSCSFSWCQSRRSHADGGGGDSLSVRHDTDRPRVGELLAAARRDGNTS